MGTNLEGGPLPEPWITQESHDRVVAATGLTGPDDYGGDHAYVHWLASGDTLVFFGNIIDEQQVEIDRLRAELAACQNPPTPPPPEPSPTPEGCENPSDFRDGGGGALWKPVSESTGNPIILYPSNLTGNLERGSCEIFDSSGKRLMECPFRTVANENREHYQVNVRASQLPRDILVRVKKKSGGYDCRIVPDPTQRID